MNKRWFLALSVVQSAIGFLITLSFVVLAIYGYEGLTKNITTLVIGLFFLVMGVFGIARWLKDNKR
ncbi:MAG: hypothetical protein IKY44_00725 [Clostridia bacterium]|nr:hypothetical protein [Clostridia bacterium]